MNNAKHQITTKRDEFLQLLKRTSSMLSGIQRIYHKWWSDNFLWYIWWKGLYLFSKYVNALRFGVAWVRQETGLVTISSNTGALLIQSCPNAKHYSITIWCNHYNDVTTGAMASQITSLTVVYSTVCSGRSKKTSKLRVTGLCAGISLGTGEFPHKWPVTRKMFPFDDVIMLSLCMQVPSRAREV